MIPHDKTLHLIVGVAIFAVAHLFTDTPCAIAAALVAAISKEVYDYTTKKGTPDWQDAAYTFAGGVLGAVCTIQL